MYHYCYDEPNDKGLYEVAFEAERNEEGIKPCYIEMWYPGEDIDRAAVETCARAFCDKFLSKQVDRVLLKDIPPFEEVAEHYRDDAAHYPVRVVFADELVGSLAEQWKMPEENVLEILKSSVDGSGIKQLL
jgi:hypothetical protein